jgi:2-polyprenyl-3-methyl-5-hydroxy-6-metoxy-1,4-benzoquinol methylase
MSDGTPDPRQTWEARYAADEYLFGTEPNDFLRETVAGLHHPTSGLEALCVADGEGRNGVFLAENGFQVTSVDLTGNGLAKARRLATARGVTLNTVVADLGRWDLGTGTGSVVQVIARRPA